MISRLGMTWLRGDQPSPKLNRPALFWNWGRSLRLEENHIDVVLEEDFKFSRCFEATAKRQSAHIRWCEPRILRRPIPWTIIFTHVNIHVQSSLRIVDSKHLRLHALLVFRINYNFENLEKLHQQMQNSYTQTQPYISFSKHPTHPIIPS